MKTQITLFVTLFLSLTFLPFTLQAQLPPLQPEQDCVNAIPVCQNTYFQPNSYQGEGANPNEINPGPSCLNSGERNDVWYIFTVQTTGQLGFSITPVNLANDYDWAVYNLTNNPCSDIFGTPSLEVSCNYSGSPGVTGPNGLTGPQNEPLINVTAGETYVVNVSNFSGTGSGYTLDFGVSTAAIFDNIPPEVVDVQADCGGNILLTFSENIVCSSVDFTDFTITDLTGTPYTITGVNGANCLAGGTFESIFEITSTPAFTAGDYIISLVDDVVDNCGNIGIYGSDTITIFLPNIAVNAATDTICAGDNLTLSTPSVPGFTYLWNPGGLVGNSITVSPVTTTTYTVQATAPNGCVYAGDTTITVIQIPTANFSAVPNQICPDDPITATYVGTSLPQATFTWDFGSANVLSGSGSGPYDLSWATPGTQTISLTVDQFGCTSPVVTGNVTVFPLPEATFTGTPEVCPLSPATYTYSGNASAAATYNWDFDGGFVISGSGQGPIQVEWPTPGPKNICLIVTENGCVSTVNCQPTTVNPLPVVSVSEQPAQCLNGNEFTFVYNTGIPILNYTWDLGEPGAVSSDSIPSYSYASPGDKIITLTVTDQNGCINTGNTLVTVHPQTQPDFDFLPVCFGNQTPFTDQSVPGLNAPILLWQWDFGGQGTSPQPSPDFAFTEWGNYDVSLEVTNVFGCRDTLTQSVEVFEQPIADFAVESVCDSETVAFINTTAYSQNQISYDWTLGNDSLSELESPNVIYAGPGAYQVSLVTTTDDGCIDAVVDTVNVWPLPIAAFTADSVCLSDRTNFQNLSVVDAPGELATYRWEFDNGLQSEEWEPSFLLPEANIFGVELLVTTQHGCQDSLSAEVPVYPNPVSFFSFENACEVDSLRFRNLSTVTDSITGDFIAAWQWDFGDGTGTGALDGPGHLYLEDGAYRVRLTTFTDKGCSSFIGRNVEAYPTPPAPVVVGDTVCFSDQAFLLAPPARPELTVEWYRSMEGDTPFQEGFAFTTPPVPYPLDYFVEAISSEGCRSVRVPVRAEVYDAVDARIVQSAEVLDIPNAILGLELAGVSNVNTVRWDLGDGSLSSVETPVHEYQFPGIYPINVDVTTENGCAFSLDAKVEVKQVMGIHVPTAFSPNGDGINDQFFIGASLMRQMQIKIFNRWGREIFTSDNLDFRWDGTLPGGGVAQKGVYVYRIEGQNYQGESVTESGTITLLR
ncbi:MAG: PKD domain-containing protein [Bacteroidota bacterium]